MEIKNHGLSEVFELALKRDPHKKEFHQALKELLISLEPVSQKQPELCSKSILERLIEVL